MSPAEKAAVSVARQSAELVVQKPAASVARETAVPVVQKEVLEAVLAGNAAVPVARPGAGLVGQKQALGKTPALLVPGGQAQTTSYPRAVLVIRKLAVFGARNLAVLGVQPPAALAVQGLAVPGIPEGGCERRWSTRTGCGRAAGTCNRSSLRRVSP